ncbi:MAG: hypothetical protein ABI600_18095 [Luteolibacter sp.]
MKADIFRKSITCFACVIVLAGRLSADLVNGGFESGFAGWEATGNVAVLSGAPYNPTEGTKLAAFNSGNSAPNGLLIQRPAVIPGHHYRLEFDIGNLSYNSQHQKLRVAITSADVLTFLLSETIDIPGPGGGATAYVAASYEFVPTTQTSVVIAFKDESPATNSLDLVLDHVRLTEIPDSPPSSLVNGGFEAGLTGWEATGHVAVLSGAPYNPTEGTKLAAFNSGNSTPDGLLIQRLAVIPGHRYRLEFDVGNLAYNSLHQRMRVTVASADFLTFLLTDSIDIPGPGGGATAYVAASYEFIPTTQTFVAIAFRDESPATNSLDLVLDRVRLTDVSSSPAPLANGGFENGLDGWNPGGNVAVYSSPPYRPTEGTKLIAFNSANSAPTGNIGQFLSVIPGQHYRLQFDVGNLSFNSQHQKIQVWLFYNTGMLITSLVFDTIEIPGPGGGATAWVAASYDFTAPAGGVISLRFADVSTVTNSLDLVLDNVRIVPIP